MLSGVGFMADTYDLFVINIAFNIMSDKYDATTWDETLVKLSALVGSVFGQLIFGYYADIIGRKRIFIMTCLMTIIGSIASACITDTGAWGIYGWLIFFRFILGFGIGGEYPLSATITAEKINEDRETKITNLATVFSMQGVGQIVSGLVLIFVTFCIEDKEIQWRLALGLGAVPMICSIYHRCIMEETDAFSESVVDTIYDDKQPPLSNTNNYIETGNNDIETGNNSPNQQLIARKLPVMDSIKKYKWQLVGTAGAWFLLDIVFYANGLFSGSITKSMGTSSSNRSMAVQVFILQCMSMPGYITSVFRMHKDGCKTIQLNGFAVITVVFAIMAALQSYLEKVGPLYIIIYGLTFFFENYGPNATTYVIPAIIYPTDSRATCHGISAACGKVGAIFGVLVLLHLKNVFCSGGECDDDSPSGQVNHGLQLTFGFCAFIGILGWIWTYYLVDDEIHDSLKTTQRSVSMSSRSSNDSTN
jgi:MFS transporter, PHS family, inorganic phosphate transporter